MPSFIPGVSPQAESAFGLTGLLGAIIYAIFHVRRKASRDGAEIIKDRIEGRLIEDLHRDRENVLKERDAARDSERAAWDKANSLAVTNASQAAKIEYQQQEITRLTTMVTELQSTLDEVKRRLQQLSKGATGYSGYGDPIEQPDR